MPAAALSDVFTDLLFINLDVVFYNAYLIYYFLTDFICIIFISLHFFCSAGWLIGYGLCCNWNIVLGNQIDTKPSKSGNKKGMKWHNSKNDF